MTRRKPGLSVLESRLEAYKNERDGVAEYLEGLNDLLDKAPNDRWALKQRAHYRKRLTELEEIIAQFE